MAHAFTPGLSVSPHLRVTKRRELPIAGEILVKIGDVVSANQSVGRAALEGELRIVRAAEMLGIPPEDLQMKLKVSTGDEVLENAVLAELRGLWGLFRSTITSPTRGAVEFISDSTGHIGIRAPSRMLELEAYTAGLVVDIESGRSVTIQSEGAFIQGIFGVGGERVGTLRALGIEPSIIVDEGRIPTDCKGHVLVGGHNPTIGSLLKAQKLGAVGFVTGSIDDITLRDYVGYDIGVAITGDEPVTMSLIVTEGFGSIPMSGRVWELVRSLSGRPCSINGATQVRAGAIRPEIIVPRTDIDSDHSAPSEGSTGLEVGSRIRLIRVPYFGMFGTVTALPHEPRRIETGAWTRVLEAKLDAGSVVTVPRANVERA